ncbi:hypothetical protein [Desulfovibrio psychrotolerans]|jgi:hypothetical protein|uniref:Uncharacterized protein n=1 Tax=Desulfovibrio psychrotolerans TaxID=415242 RepID=A0A7J0BXQ3_9BACT|nr:hypothetical protein [Desulfovibrio psychrotolerans]GFM37961.1 hypothetical protein DSM19430T_26450 [Desulfovibrio psychrotolerans]
MRQLSLFDSKANRFALLDREVKAAMAEACKRFCDRHRVSREEVVSRMNSRAREFDVRITGGNAKELTDHIFAKWLSPSAPDHMPSIRALNVFMDVVGDLSPLSVQAAVHDGAVVDAEQLRLLERAEVERQIKQLQRRKKQLEEAIR